MHNITILYYFTCNSSWRKTLDEFTNIVNPNSQLRHSRYLLVHLKNPKHLPILNSQQRLSLLQDTNIKTIMFCIPKIISRMMQPSQNITTCSLVRHKKNYNISTISTPTHHSQSIASTYSSILNSNTPTILPPVGK